MRLKTRKTDQARKQTLMELDTFASVFDRLWPRYESFWAASHEDQAQQIVHNTQLCQESTVKKPLRLLYIDALFCDDMIRKGVEGDALLMIVTKRVFIKKVLEQREQQKESVVPYEKMTQCKTLETLLATLSHWIPTERLPQTDDSKALIAAVTKQAQKSRVEFADLFTMFECVLYFHSCQNALANCI